jgi:hypothetical protein
MASFPALTTSSSMGTSSRFGVPKSARFTPGPGAYCGNEITASQYASSPSAPWNASTSAPLLRRSTSSEYMGQGSTFGAQSTSVRSSTPACSFGSARRLPREDKVPGPGAYGFSSSFARSAEKRNGIGSAFGGSQDLGRLATWSALPLEEQTPGPHQAGPSSCGGGQILSDWQSSGSAKVAFPSRSIGRDSASPTCHCIAWRGFAAGVHRGKASAAQETPGAPCGLFGCRRGAAYSSQLRFLNRPSGVTRPPSPSWAAAATEWSLSAPAARLANGARKGSWGGAPLLW